MISFSEYVNETVINAVDSKSKEKYSKDIWDLIQLSYKDIGGIKGNGFENITNFIDNTKMWKFTKHQNKILAGIIYKDKSYRKAVAVFTNGSKEGKNELIKLLKADFERSLIEVSHGLLNFLEKKVPVLIKKYAIPSDSVSSIINKDVTVINKYKYQRLINNEPITKMLLGKEKIFYEF